MATWPELREQAATLGHAQLAVEQSRRGYHGTCACGFSTPRIDAPAQAARMLRAHVVDVVSKARAERIAFERHYRAS